VIFALGFVILVASVASLTRLAHDDVIAAPWRVRMAQKYGPSGYIPRMLECFRCTAIWVAKIPTLFALLAAGAALGLGPAGWLLMAVAWYPTVHAVAYLSYLLYLRGEA
jgi:hypothetical protein